MPPPSTSHVLQKGKKKVGKCPFIASITSSYSHVDANLDGFKQILDEEFRIPMVKELGVQKAQDNTRGQKSHPRPRKFGSVKNLAHIDMCNTSQSIYG